MKRVVACVVLAVAMAGCGDGESAWHAEFRRQFRSDNFVPDLADQPLCIHFKDFTFEEREEVRRGLVMDFDFLFVDAKTGIDELLAVFGIERTPAIEDEVVDLAMDELEQLCPLTNITDRP